MNDRTEEKIDYEIRSWIQKAEDCKGDAGLLAFGIACGLKIAKSILTGKPIEE
jgi:hypothetical protein